MEELREAHKHMEDDMDDGTSEVLEQHLKAKGIARDTNSESPTEKNSGQHKAKGVKPKLT